MGRRGYTRTVAQAAALPTGFELPLKQRLPRIGSIDQVGVEARAGELAKRSIKREAKVWALELAIRCIDLTTLEGADTPGKVAALCSKAIRPDPSDPAVPSVAAVCVYPNLVPVAVDAPRRHRRQGGVRRDRVPVRAEPARDQAARGRGRGRSSARTRSTW